MKGVRFGKNLGEERQEMGNVFSYTRCLVGEKNTIEYADELQTPREFVSAHSPLFHASLYSSCGVRSTINTDRFAAAYLKASILVSGVYVS